MKWLSWFKARVPQGSKGISKNKVMAYVDGLEIYGPYSESGSGEYLLIRRDSDLASGRCGFRTAGGGTFYLFKDERLICSAECERPTHGAVSNAGLFVIGDSLFGENANSKMFIFEPSGGKRLDYDFSAKIVNLQISPKGRYVVVQLAESRSGAEDAGKLFVFDGEKGSLLSSFRPVPGWARSYEFCEAEKLVFLNYENGRKYRYTVDGVFMDEARYAREHLEDASPIKLVYIVRDRIQGASKEALPELLGLLNRALSGEALEHRSSLALAYKLKGNILDAMDDPEKAIAAYQKALEADPKIGVKRRLVQLIEASVR